MGRRGYVVGVVGVVGVGMLVATPGTGVPVTGLAGAATGASAPALAVADVEYRMVDLGTLGGNESWAYGVNERGQIVGASQTDEPRAKHAFLWDPVKGMTDLGTLGGHARAVAVNAEGQAVGYAYNSAGNRRAFLWDAVAGMTDLGTLGGSTSTAVGINDRGQVVGWAGTSSGHSHAFLWDPVKGMTDLGTLGGDWSTARVVNEQGQVAGDAHTATGESHAFLWDPVAGMTDLGTLGGDRSTVGTPSEDWWAEDALNEKSQVVGGARTASGDVHAFLWDPVAGMADLGTLGGGSSWAFDLNDRGQVAGWTPWLWGLSGSHAFLWDPVKGMIDLGLAATGLPHSDVNEYGQVAGVAINAFGGDGAFLWDPVAGMTDLGGLVAPVILNDAGQVAGTAAFSTGKRAVLWTPVGLVPRVRVRVAQAGYGDELRVSVDPDRVGEAWRFRVQKQVAGLWTTLPGVYQTRGTAETRRLTLGPGRFRVRVLSRFGYTGATSAPVRLTRKTVRVQLDTDAARTRLRVDVDPNMGSGSWTFRVQRKRADGSWRTLHRNYTTCGARERRTLDLRRGTYRVRVLAKYGYRGATSAAVELAA